MIELHRKDATRLLINPRYIVVAERSDDGGSTILLSNGRAMGVSETVPEIESILTRDWAARFGNRHSQTRE